MANKKLTTLNVDRLLYDSIQEPKATFIDCKLLSLLRAEQRKMSAGWNIHVKRADRKVIAYRMPREVWDFCEMNRINKSAFLEKALKYERQYNSVLDCKKSERD